MLGKLIKHEFRTTSRYILLIMAALVIITPIAAIYLRYSGGFINRLNLSSDIIGTLQKFFSGICILVYVIAVIGVAFTTFISLLYRFYKSMISSEGYLTHTLPVKTSSILFSKGFVALVWSIASSLLIILSIAVFTRILGAWTMSDLSDAAGYITAAFDAADITIGHCMAFIIALILQLICNIAMIGAGFAIGHRMSGHPILGTIVSYLGITFVLQILTSVIMAVFAPVVEVFSNTMSISTGLYWMLTAVNVYNIIFAVVFSLITVYMFKNKLNI